MREYFKPETLSWHYPDNWPRNIRYWFKWLKWSKQRAFRGYADCDCWSVDGYLAQILPDMIDRLQDTHGVPVDKDGKPMRIHKWIEILEKIKQGFLAAQRIQGFYGEEPNFKEDVIIFNEGMDLFKQYFFDLWD